MNNSERDLRQRDLVPPERLAACRASVVGVGAIGRQVALQLSAIGVPRLQLIDHDVVEPVNLACQGFLEGDLGMAKVEATAEICSRLNTNVVVKTIQGRFRRSMEVGNVLFSCVDSITTRRLVWEGTRDRVAFFCDGRMAAEVLRVVVAADSESRAHYATTLFDPGDAYRGSCTARSTIFCANIAAGFMVSQFSRWLRALPGEKDMVVNLLASEMSLASTMA